MHINLEWGLWSQEPSHQNKSLQNPKSLKMLCSIYHPNVQGFKLSIHQFKGLVMLVEIKYCRLKSMHIWQQGGHGNIGYMVHEMVMLFSYCLGPFEVGNLKNSQKCFCLTSRPNLYGFQLSIHHLKALSEPIKIRYCDQKSIDILKLWREMCPKTGAWHFSTSLGKNWISP